MTKRTVWQTGGWVVLAGLATGCASSEQAIDPNDAASLDEAYEKAIRAAAIKTPDFQRDLVPIPASASTVSVVTLTPSAQNPVAPGDSFRSSKRRYTPQPASGTDGVLTDDTWVSLPAESQPFCAGSADPLLTLQQLLGMPAQDGDWIMVAFSVDPSQVFRPCASGPDITTTTCSFTPPSGDSEEATQLFVFDQMWSSYETGFSGSGYPFTGMGWTWNWDPAASDPYGVSEYVVMKNAPVTDIKTMTPEEFCAGT